MAKTPPRKLTASRGCGVPAGNALFGIPLSFPALIGVLEGSLTCGTSTFKAGDFFWLPPDGPESLVAGPAGAAYLHVRIPTPEEKDARSS